MTRLFLVFLLLGFAPSAIGASSARTLNARGFRLYRKGLFPEAMAQFKRAIDTDDRYALAHYNYAATLGVLRRVGKACEHGAFKAEILAHLERSIALDPSRKARASKDRDFEPVRDTLRYQQLYGLDPKELGSVGPLLQHLSWFSSPQGAYGPRFEIHFDAAGKLVLWERTIDAKGTVTREQHSGTYRVEGRKVLLALDSTPAEVAHSLEGTLGEDGKLEVPVPIGSMSDDPAECEA